LGWVWFNLAWFGLVNFIQPAFVQIFNIYIWAPRCSALPVTMIKLFSADKIIFFVINMSMKA
jgi:hypothetical protein